VDITSIVNCCFGWILVILALIGNYLTWKRVGQRWAFWNVLAAGWAFFAVSHTLLLAGVDEGSFLVLGIWLSSYIIVITSLVLLFIKLTKQIVPQG
jgi:hypothetical protein